MQRKRTKIYVYTSASYNWQKLWARTFITVVTASIHKCNNTQNWIRIISSRPWDHTRKFPSSILPFSRKRIKSIPERKRITRNFTEMQLSANPEDRSKTAPGHRRIDLLHVIAREGLTRRFLALLSTGETRLSNHRVPDELQIPYTCNGNRVPPLFFFLSFSPFLSPSLSACLSFDRVQKHENGEARDPCE